MSEREQPDRLYGLLAVFTDPDALLCATRQMRAAGYRELEGHTPFPVEGLDDALGVEESRLPFIALAGGILGGSGGLLMQWYLNAYDYPINVGGRPLDAWPAFAVPAFETSVLGAVLAVVGAMLWLNGLPRLHHPLFDAPSYRRVSLDRFCLSVRREDPCFDREATARLLEGLGASVVEEVPA